MAGGTPSEGSDPLAGSSETGSWGEKPETPVPAGSPHEEATILGSLDVHRPGGDDHGDRPTGVVDSAEFRRALIEVGLIDETELDTLAAAVPESQGALGLARLLQQSGRITAYQAAALFQRKSRGLLIGNYLILDKLGAGGMGMVFKSRHRRLGRVVALKIRPPSFARDRTAVLQFHREVEAAGRLKHPNIVAALDADEDRGVHFLVMEYVEGSDLDRVVRHRGPLPLGQAIDFLIQAARGLEAAHAQGIVHRDIKPSNLMLDAAGTVRVLDLARLVNASNPFGQAAGARLTESSMYMGTVAYMAPEQSEDSRRADHRADIYSLGCTFYFLLTGREPFVGDTVLKRLMAHLERPAPLLQVLRPDAPTSVEDIFQRMMAKRPEDRPASMTEVIDLLEACKDPVAEVAQGRGSVAKAPPRPVVFDDGGRKSDKGEAPPRAGREDSILARRDDPGVPQVGPELNIEDLVMDVRSEVALPTLPGATTPRGPRPRSLDPKHPAAIKARTPRRVGRLPIIAGLAATAILAAAVVRFGFFPAGDRSRSGPAVPTDGRVGGNPVPPKHDAETHGAPISPQPRWVERTIFDGKSPKGWILSRGRTPLSPKHIQPDGLNPHGTGSYLVVYDKPAGDFILDFDYKLSKGCNSGVFLRVGDLDDPVHTGLEVSMEDWPGTGDEAPGAIHGLVAPSVNAQRPAGQWNRMRITAQGPMIAVSLNGTDVSRIRLDEWTVPGKRPDGTPHRFTRLAPAKLPRRGYLGFQDLVGDCWFKDIVVRTPEGPSDRPASDADR